MGCTSSTQSAGGKAAPRSRNAAGKGENLSSGGGSSGAAPPSQRTMIVASKTGIANLKEIPESELKKHKVRDILGFVKAGNLAMVHGLIQYHGLGQSVMLL